MILYVNYVYIYVYINLCYDIDPNLRNISELDLQFSSLMPPSNVWSDGYVRITYVLRIQVIGKECVVVKWGNVPDFVFLR